VAVRLWTAGHIGTGVELLIGSNASQAIWTLLMTTVSDGPHTAGTQLVWVSGGPLGEGGGKPGQIGCPAVPAHPIYTGCTLSATGCYLATTELTLL
jgi:hypothetical protein